MDQFFKRSFSVVKIPSPEKLFRKEGSSIFMGSCFAENLFKYYEKNYVDSLFSPFGNIYNPLSLSKTLDRICSTDPINESELFYNKELWRHFDFDTQLSTTDKMAYLNTINKKLQYAQSYILKANYIFLTLGTSFIYRERITDNVVNNCHKLPSNHFSRENASIQTMTESLLDSLKKLLSINPHITIIMTLSPVRHLRDSAIENSLSKARLRSVIDEVSKQIPLWYFPAYEILLDQLRDYRWYNTDLAHPSDSAVQYIMTRFVESACDDDFQIYLNDIGKLNKSLNHKTLHSETEETRKFQDSIKRNFDSLLKKYPKMMKLQDKYDALFSGNR